MAVDFLHGYRKLETVDYFFENGFEEVLVAPKGVLIRGASYRERDLEPTRISLHLDHLQQFVSTQ
jgi:hypothetical protein